MFAGLDGLLLYDPHARTQSELMPGSLIEAVDALGQYALFSDAMGSDFII